MCLAPTQETPYLPEKESRWKVLSLYGGTLKSPFRHMDWTEGWQHRDLDKFGQAHDKGFHCYTSRQDADPLANYFIQWYRQCAVVELEVEGFVSAGVTDRIGEGLDGHKCEVWQRVRIKHIELFTDGSMNDSGTFQELILKHRLCA